ncbi:MAG TPA: farnesyl diphosphate synthase [Xanthomonadales bacterium]|nr:farnesyl diphosphate synthase [Xanthomonadales bacterium]
MPNPLPHNNTLVDSWRVRFEQVLAQSLPPDSADPVRLHQAMRYSALAGGKRIRPLLVYASGHALGVLVESLDSLACSLELIHAYSLIHDDLPAMDDDDWRRGRATCHLAFDEATAILAGDALQALAFERLATDQSHQPGSSLRLMQMLAHACGSEGMAGGQMLDLNANGRNISLAELEHIHALKTGALIRLAVTGPALLAQVSPGQSKALEEFGHCVGLGFQIRDDILDVTGESSKTGKATRADAARNQPTFPALIGLEESQNRAEKLLHQAVAALKAIPGDTSPLLQLAQLMIQRDH